MVIDIELLREEPLGRAEKRDESIHMVVIREEVPRRVNAGDCGDYDEVIHGGVRVRQPKEISWSQQAMKVAASLSD